MSARSDETASAANWKTVVAADGLVGVVPLVTGLALAARGTVFWGGLVAAGGAVYVVLVARRALRWKRLRADAGLGPTVNRRRRRGSRGPSGRGTTHSGR